MELARGFPVATRRRASEETDLDVVLSSAHGTLPETGNGLGRAPWALPRRMVPADRAHGPR